MPGYTTGNGQTVSGGQVGSRALTHTHSQRASVHYGRQTEAGARHHACTHTTRLDVDAGCRSTLRRTVWCGELCSRARYTHAGTYTSARGHHTQTRSHPVSQKKTLLRVKAKREPSVKGGRGPVPSSCVYELCTPPRGELDTLEDWGEPARLAQLRIEHGSAGRSARPTRETRHSLSESSTVAAQSARVPAPCLHESLALAGTLHAAVPVPVTGRGRGGAPARRRLPVPMHRRRRRRFTVGSLAGGGGAAARAGGGKRRGAGREGGDEGGRHDWCWGRERWVRATTRSGVRGEVRLR